MIRCATRNGTEVLDPYFEHEFRDFSPNPEEICAKEEHQAALRQAIAELRPSLRNVVELYQLQECVAAANARLFHARASLRGNKALLLNHKAARHVSRKRFSCAMSCTAPFELDGFVDALARRIAAAKNLVNRVSLPSADRLLAAITSLETALTWPETQQRSQNLLQRGLQRDSDFEARWPEVLGTLLET